MALCLLGVMALAQVVVAGMALAIRFKQSGGTRVVEREVIREVRVNVPTEITSRSDQPPMQVSHGHTTVKPPQYLPVAEPHNLQPSPLAEPSVEDPEAARLLKEAREARVAADMGKAIVKLEQALHHAPGEPGVVYELAVVHEEMGIYDKAAVYYEEVFRMGMTRAGALYPLAAAKLRDGFSQPADMLGKLSLGRVQIFKNPQHGQGQQVILTIPVQKAPDREVEMDSIEVEVRFFNRSSRGEISELDDASWVNSQWISLPWDWAAGLEQLRMTYTIPKSDIATEHLFGELSYYGQVVTLSYGGEVLDVQAWPRDLAARITRQPQDGYGELPVPEFHDSLPPGFDPNVPLLPTLPE
jgi:hypothetical protein